MASTPLSITKSTLADLPLLAPLLQGYRAFYRCESNSLEESLKFLEDRFANNDSVIFLAQEGEESLGFLQMYPLLSTLALSKVLLVNDLFVTESARGKGVGRKLLEAATDFARQDGAVRLHLKTEIANEAAKSLYVKFGFVLDTTFSHYTLPI